MDAQKLADVMDRFAASINDFADELRGGAAGNGAAAPGYNAPDVAARVGREVEEVDVGDLTPDSDVEVNIGDLWRVVNGARYMVRMAREGKVPNQDQRMPLNRALRALKGDIPALRKGGIGRLIRDHG